MEVDSNILLLGTNNISEHLKTNLSFLKENQLNKSERLLHFLEKANKDQNQFIESLQQENAVLLDSKEVQKSEINSLKSQKISLESQLEVFKKKIFELEGTVLELAEKNTRNLSDLSRDTQENEEETLKMIKERDLLKTQNEELTVSSTIYKNLIGNLERSLEGLKGNSEKREEEFIKKQEEFESELKDFRMKMKDYSLENNGLKQNLSFLQEELKKKEDLLNNKEFELKNSEFKLKEEELNSHKRELELKGNLEEFEVKFNEKCLELDETKEKMDACEKGSKEKEVFFEEKLQGLEKYKQEIEQLLEEKKQENTRLYAQFQAGMRQRSSLESLRLPFEQENDEKILQKTLDLQIQHSMTKEQNVKYRNELDHIKEELKRKIPLLEVRKKEYDQMLDQYGVLKSKLELSLFSNSKLVEDSKIQQKMMEEVKKDHILASKNIKDLSLQISILLYFCEKMRSKIHELSPYFDLSVYSDYKIPLVKLKLESKDQLIFANIDQLQEKNKNLIERLNRMHLNEGSQINPLEFSELKGKLARFEAEINEKQRIIENLHEKIKKLQTLEDVKQLILSKNPEKMSSTMKDQDFSNKSALQKNSKFYEKHEKLLEENSSLRKELKRLKIDLKKLTFSHENLTSISEKQEERIKNSLESLNSMKDAFNAKDQEMHALMQEKQSLSEEIYQQKIETSKLKTKILEQEKRLVFAEDSKKAFEEGLIQAMNEKKKYFEGFLLAQREISENLMRHKAELKSLRTENQGILTEKTKFKENFLKREQEFQEERMKFKGKIENQEVMLIQLNKKSLLNSQIITEQNQQILELNKKISMNFAQNFIEEGMFSGFVHISQQKNVNFEEIKENLETQKNCYESLIGKMTEKLGVLEQENLVFQENIKNLEAANEELQEKLQESMLKLQEMEKEAENPRINPEEIELLNEEKESYLREIQELNGKLQDIIKEKNELQGNLSQNIEKDKTMNEEYIRLEDDLKEKERKLEFEKNVNHLKEILLQEQYELFKGQMKEMLDRNIEKIKENDALVERLQRKEEEKKEGAMEIEENEGNEGEKWEEGEILRLRENAAQLELKLQEKIKEEFIFKTQANQLKKQLEIRIQEVVFGKEKEFNQSVEEIIQSKDSHISELTHEISEIKGKIARLQEEKDKLAENNQNLSNQLKMKEVQIVLSQELKNKSIEALEEGEIERPLDSQQNEAKLTENELALIKEIIKDQKLVELLEKCKKILIYQSLETKI